MKYWLTLNEKDQHSTNYIEFKPGPFQKKWWNSDSLYIEEDTYVDLLIPVLNRVFEDFAYTSSYSISAEEWDLLFDACMASHTLVQDVMAEIHPWAEKVFEKESCITILGM